MGRGGELEGLRVGTEMGAKRSMRSSNKERVTRKGKMKGEGN